MKSMPMKPKQQADQEGQKSLTNIISILVRKYLA